MRPNFFFMKKGHGTLRYIGMVGFQGIVGTLYNIFFLRFTARSSVRRRAVRAARSARAGRGAAGARASPPTTSPIGSNTTRKHCAICLLRTHSSSDTLH